jgi:dolichyl-phosphate-mannose--protein O-mannosyl transferase
MSSLLRRLNRQWVAILAVTAIGAGLRFTGLSSPAEPVFDEFYYPKAACILLGESNRTCLIREDNERYFRRTEWDVGSWVHPHLGKWQIALGIRAFGMDPFGWRFSTAAAGTLVVTFTSVIAAIAFRRPIWTFVTGLLLATEHMHVVMSRVALLDVHVALWVTLGFLLLVLDKRWIELRTPDRPRDPPGVEVFRVRPVEETPVTVPSPLLRPWRLAAGVAFGAAVAVKWSGLLALAAGVLLALGWEVSRRVQAGRARRSAIGRAVLQESFGLVVSLLVVPISIYVLTWLPWLHHFGHDPIREPARAAAAWWDQHGDMWRYHAELQEFERDPESGERTPTHPSYSPPWRWVVNMRPVSMFVEDLGPDVRQVLALGNPVTFWLGLWALPFAAWAWLRRDEWVGGLAVVAYAVQLLPWLAVARPQFSFYIVPMTPFLVLADVLLLRALADVRLVAREADGSVATSADGRPAVSRLRPFRPLAALVVVAAVALFVWAWPVLTASRISDERWRQIVWFDSWV